MDAAGITHVEERGGITPRRALWAAGAGAAIFGVSFATGDPWFFLIALLGPFATGLALRLAGRPWRLGAAAWALYGLYSLVYDWLLTNEDKAFHVALTLVMVGLVALGAAFGSVLSRRTVVSHTLRRSRG